MSEKGKKKKKKTKILDVLLPAIALSHVHVLPHLPLWVSRLLATAWFLVLYPIAIVTGLRKRYERNIKIAFQDQYSRAEIRGIARRTIYNWLTNVFEMLHFYHVKSHESVVDCTRIEGLEKINRAKKDGIGAVGVTAHYGNFAVMMIRLHLEGVKLSFLFKEIKPRKLGALMSEYQQRLGHDLIITNVHENPTREITEDLESSGFVVFVADEFKRKTGVDVDFFGKRTRMALGPAVASLKTGAPILPLFIVREGRGFKIVIEDPLEVELTGDTEKDLAAITQARMSAIEEYIRRHPDEWLWVHSRWID